MRSFAHRLKALLFFILFSSAAFSQKTISSGKQLFDYNWKFQAGDHSQFSSATYNDENWRQLDLPHDWSIEGNTNRLHLMGNDGGYYPAGIGWYRKTFDVPATFKGKRVSIYFEGVYMNAEVFLNGKSLGMHPYGYTSFSYELTPYLIPGAKNQLSIRVDNSMQKNCRWYSGSGIYRHVWLSVSDELHIPQWGVSISTPEITGEKAVIEVKTVLNNTSTASRKATLITQLTAKVSGKKAGNASIELTLAPGEKRTVTQRILVQRPLLWEVEKPHLYTASVQVKQGNKVVDQSQHDFGIRTIAFSADKGFQLNGKTIKLNGGCVHHDNGLLGAAAFDRAEKRKAELLKAAGFNAVRTAHNPPSEAFLDACDQLGLLVIDESFDGWRTAKTKYDYASIFDAWWERDIEAMVKRDINHPSIILWSIGNEIIERKEPSAVETAKMLAEAVRKLDPTRPVTSAMTTWDSDWELFDPLMAAHDVAGYNYQLHRAPADHKRVPSRIIVQTESYPRDAFANWQLVQQNPYIIGDFVWTAIDYLGESGIGRYFYKGETPGEHYERDIYPWHGAYCGDIDLLGWRKPISHYRDLLYNKQKKLYMAVKEPNHYLGEIKETMWSVWPTWESWTWPGYEGKNIEVDIYSRYPMVRLYLNDSLIAERTITEKDGYRTTIALPYANGKLRLAGVVNGKEVEETRLITAGTPASVKLIADRKMIHADGQDLSFVAVEITDKEGNIDPNASRQLNFDLTGAGTIIATGSANLQDSISYTALQRMSWKGRAMVVIKSGKEAGEGTLTVRSEGLAPASIKITMQKK